MTGLGAVFWITLTACLSLGLAQVPCRYIYIEQPPLDLSCNPYPNRALLVRCTLSYSSIEEPVSIHWRYYSDSLTTVTDISQSNSKYTLTSSTLTGRASGRLQINSLSDVDVGSYSCQGVFNNGSRTEESQRLNLHSSAVFASRRTSICTLSQGESVNIQKCALMGQAIPGNTNSNGGGTNTGGDTNSGGNSGGGGNILGALGPNAGIIIACVAVVIFIAVTVCILISCCIGFQVCRYFD